MWLQSVTSSWVIFTHWMIVLNTFSTFLKLCKCLLKRQFQNVLNKIMEHVIPHWHFSLYKWFKMEAKIWMTVETWGYMEHVISHWNVSLEHKCFKMEAKIWMAVETWDCMERVIPHWNFSLYKWFKMEAKIWMANM